MKPVRCRKSGSMQTPEGPAAAADSGAGVRINKYLADTGFCSRREADRLVASGAVTIDGIPAVTGSGVLPGQVVCVQGEPVQPVTDLVFLAFFKPVGITTTTDRRRRDNIIDFIGYPQRFSRSAAWTVIRRG